jgi:hypothetical protein
MNSNVWDYFQRKVCLSFRERPSGKPSRWPACEKEFKRVQLNGVIRFEPVQAIGPHQSFTLSQKKILSDFANSDSETLLTLEDDVMFSNIDYLRDAIHAIKLHGIKWDVLYLGGNVVGGLPKMIRRNLYKVENVWTTHAVAYTKKAASMLLSNFPNENEIMYDTYLGNCLTKLNAFMIGPMVATQRPDYSDIWQKDVDYTAIFTNSNRLLKA